MSALQFGKALFCATIIGFSITGKPKVCHGVFRDKVEPIVRKHLEERYGSIAKQLEEVLRNSIPNKEKRREFVEADEALRDLITRDGEPFIGIFKQDVKTLCNVLLNCPYPSMTNPEQFLEYLMHAFGFSNLVSFPLEESPYSHHTCKLDMPETHELHDGEVNGNGFGNQPSLVYVELCLMYLRSPTKLGNKNLEDGKDPEFPNLSKILISELINDGFIEYDNKANAGIRFNPYYIFNDMFLQNLFDLFGPKFPNGSEKTQQ